MRKKLILMTIALNGKPAASGLYIHNRRKIVIK